MNELKECPKCQSNNVHIKSDGYRVCGDCGLGLPKALWLFAHSRTPSATKLDEGVRQKYGAYFVTIDGYEYAIDRSYFTDAMLGLCQIIGERMEDGDE